MKITKFILNIIGLSNLRFSWEYPRGSIQAVKKHFGDKKLIGAEVGCWKGVNALSILKTLNLKKLYLIDPYKPYKDYDRSLQVHKRFDSLGIGKGFYDSNPQKVMNEAKRQCQENVKGFDCVEFMEKTSFEAVEYLPELDFVYIDGNHEYEYIKKDIELYWNKIKKGGILSGHDIDSLEFPGIRKAVIEFVVYNNLDLYINVNDWWIIK